MEINSQNPSSIILTDSAKSPMPSKGAILTLVLSNLMPVFGVLFFDWDLSSILILFWLENAVIGLYTLLKIASAKGVPQQPIISDFGKNRYHYSKTFYILFFVVHYGMFTGVHGLFVYYFFGTTNLSYENFAVPLMGLFASHGISYWSNFIQKGEYITASPDRQMFSPYKRVLVMHFTVMLGGGFAKIGGWFALPALLILVILKIVVDVFSHLYEHNAFPAGIIIVKGISGNMPMFKK